MKILFLGDVVGRAGRNVILENLKTIRKENKIDVVIINVDNTAGGFGVTPELARDFLKSGADMLTGGDHVFDQKESIALLSSQPLLLRPHNFPPSVAGSGCREITLVNGKKILVLHLLGQVFHREYLDSPFACADEALKPYRLHGNIDAIFVDMHAEATSEKQAMGHYLDGRVSAVIGSHTHVPTDDARILAGGTAFQTDAGMCGDYANTIIGFKPEGPMQNFLQKHRKVRMEPGKNAGTMRGAIVTLQANGLAKSITPFHHGADF
jgi:metallophosphoesterase (TIGR00282 family)